MTTWTSWGDSQPALTATMRRLLDEEIGSVTPSPAAAITTARLAPSRLPAEVRRALGGAVGDEHVRDDDESRAWHAGGQAYGDLIRRRRGDAGLAADAVVLPADDREVGEVLRVCTEAGVAVVPWGGGTSVVGGLDPESGGHPAVVALDLRRVAGLRAVDETSLLVTFGAGTTTPDAERALDEHGLTLGHVPQSWERASLGGYVVTRSSGQASSGYGRIDDLVAGVRMQTPIGELTLPPVAGSAAGPDLRRLVLGSEGTLGVVTEVTLRARRRPAVKRYEGWVVPSWEAGTEVFRRIAQSGVRPDIARLSDPTETRISLAMGSGGLTARALSAYLRARGVADGCLVIVGFEGGDDDVAYRRRRTARVLRDAGAVPLGRRAGSSWEHNRFSGPYLRDSLLDAGVLAETLETASTWSGLPQLYDGVRAALTRSLGRAVVGCHVSHLYPTGASLYFTVLAAADTGRETEQWWSAKQAANDAIVAAGGTITHHHAVGTAHRDHLRAEIGDVGVAVLDAVKERLDPARILNPGKLLPSSAPSSGPVSGPSSRSSSPSSSSP